MARESSYQFPNSIGIILGVVVAENINTDQRSLSEEDYDSTPVALESHTKQQRAGTDLVNHLCAKPKLFVSQHSRWRFVC